MTTLREVCTFMNHNSHIDLLFITKNRRFSADMFEKYLADYRRSTVVGDFQGLEGGTIIIIEINATSYMGRRFDLMVVDPAVEEEICSSDRANHWIRQMANFRTPEAREITRSFNQFREDQVYIVGSDIFPEQ